MTARELLELAARAAGLHIKADRVDADDRFTHFVVGAKNTRERTNWNSLTDDGDALRLAAVLCFSIIQYKHSVEVTVGDELIYRELSDGTMSRIEITRRAITIAAAQIEMSKCKDN